MFSDKRYNIKEEQYSMDYELSDIDSYVSRPEERPEKPLFGWEYSISVIHHLFIEFMGSYWRVERVAWTQWNGISEGRSTRDAAWILKYQECLSDQNVGFLSPASGSVSWAYPALSLGLFETLVIQNSITRC